MEKFIADYRIPNTIGLRYCKEGRDGNFYPTRGYPV